MRKLLYVWTAASLAAFAQLPDLKVEATDGGSAFVLRNTSATQPLTAFLIELVDYPGSSYALSQDEIAMGGEPLGPGKQRRIPILNMTIGAAPDYVKVLAAIFADGSTAGTAEKAAQLVERRKLHLTTIRELVARIEKGEGSAQLQKWAASIPESASKTKRATPEVVNAAIVKSLVSDTAGRLSRGSASDVVSALRATERALVASKPTL